jgi:branched-chain amino acid transport system ATP-binding protein
MFEARELMVFYENMLALNNVGLKCGPDQIIGLFGANSAGKSTLMYVLSGIILDIQRKEQMAGGERITVLGQVTFEGQDLIGLKPSRRARKGIILCPERRRIFPESTVLENLAIGGYLATTRQKKETLDYVFRIFPALIPLKNKCWPSAGRSWLNQKSFCWMNRSWA